MSVLTRIKSLLSKRPKPTPPRPLPRPDGTVGGR